MNQTVLVIDDDPAIQQLFTILLKTDGLDVRAVASAEEAKRSVDVERPAAILLDLNLGGSDGLPIARELSQSQTPVVVVSASSDEETRERARAAGAAGFIAKPVNPRTFANEVKQHLGANGRPRAEAVDPRELRLRQLREQFLETALASIAQLSARSDEVLFSDSLLADAAHRWVGASSIEGMPDIEAAAREIETLARAKRIDRGAYIRERLSWLGAQFEASRS